jgi:hypothetical protein
VACRKPFVLSVQLREFDIHSVQVSLGWPQGVSQHVTGVTDMYTISWVPKPTCSSILDLVWNALHWEQRATHQPSCTNYQAGQDLGGLGKCKALPYGRGPFRKSESQSHVSRQAPCKRHSCTCL